jgi:hypothetical protein
MDPIEALHNAARRYCIDRHAEWTRRYSQLAAEKRDRTTESLVDWEYTDAAYDVFPRYNVLGAILSEVERFVSSDFTCVEELRSLLAVASDTAKNASTDIANPIAVRAMADERSRFAAFIAAADPAQLQGLPQLPYRRVLGNAEHARLHQEFIGKWGKWYGGARDKCGNVSPEVVTLHVAAMEATNAYERLRGGLLDRGLSRIFELRESDDGYEMDTRAAEFFYTGAEGFWSSADMSWMVYASHESSITFGASWLIEHMRASLPSFDRYRYRGWDLSQYPQSDATSG